jgi:hypothetical protein
VLDKLLHASTTRGQEAKKNDYTNCTQSAMYVHIPTESLLKTTSGTIPLISFGTVLVFSTACVVVIT